MNAVTSFVVAALIPIPVVASAQQSQTYIGVVTDTMCGANHAAMKVTPDSTCVKECVRHGGNTKLALLQGKNLYLLSDQETPATCVFCSVPHPVRGLEQVRRVLRREGRAVLLEHMRPGGVWLGRLFDWLDSPVSKIGPHVNRRTTENITAAGLRIESERRLLGDMAKLVVARRE